MLQTLRTVFAYCALLLVLAVSMPFLHMNGGSLFAVNVTGGAESGQQAIEDISKTDEVLTTRIQDQKTYNKIKSEIPLKENGKVESEGKLVKFNICIPKLTGYGHGATGDGSGASVYCAVDSLEEYLNIVYRYLVYLGGIGGTLMIVLGGFQVMISGYNEDMASKGISKIWQAILGMIFLLSISFILNSINPQVFHLDLGQKAVRDPAQQSRLEIESFDGGGDSDVNIANAFIASGDRPRPALGVSSARREEPQLIRERTPRASVNSNPQVSGDFNLNPSFNSSSGNTSSLTAPSTIEVSGSVGGGFTGGSAASFDFNEQIRQVQESASVESSKVSPQEFDIQKQATGDFLERQTATVSSVASVPRNVSLQGSSRDSDFLAANVSQGDFEPGQLQVLDIHMGDSVSQIEQEQLSEQSDTPQELALAKVDTSVALQRDSSFERLQASDPRELSQLKSAPRNEELLDSQIEEQGEIGLDFAFLDFSQQDDIEKVEEELQDAQKDSPQELPVQQREIEVALQRQDTKKSAQDSQVRENELAEIEKQNWNLEFSGFENFDPDFSAAPLEIALNDSLQQQEMQEQEKQRQTAVDVGVTRRDVEREMERQDSSTEEYSTITETSLPDRVGSDSVLENERDLDVFKAPRMAVAPIEYDLGGDLNVEGVGSRVEDRSDFEGQIIDESMVVYVVQERSFDCRRRAAISVPGYGDLEAIDSSLKYAACLSFSYGYDSAVNSPLFVDVVEGFDVEYENINFDMLCRLGSQYSNVNCSSLDVVESEGNPACEIRNGQCRESQQHVAYRNGELLEEEIDLGEIEDNPSLLVLDIPTTDEMQKFYDFVFDSYIAPELIMERTEGDLFVKGYKIKDPKIGSYDILVARFFDSSQTLVSEEVYFGNEYRRVTGFESDGHSVVLETI